TLPLANRLTVPAELAAERVRLDPESGRLSALLVVSIAGEPRYHIAAHGRVRELIEVPVLARPLAQGEVVAAADLEWTTVPAGSLARGGLSDPDALVGAEARRRLAAGRVLREGDVGPPLLVRRGRAVTMVYARDGLSLAALGKPLEDGALGAVVRVVNVDSRRQVQGVVAGPDRIDLGPPTAAAVR
ncbi:MAG TPA: flagellar basal body P-ring formation chaperone FlgA, partial [Geminicoccaceae bacterium]|nr:flagellar basal body P-ring formation chaperone FlgA [Geminicoccaceae bacterium]